MLNLFWQPSDSIRHWLPSLQSHRGYCQSGLPENTLQSIEKAVQLGYKMIEFDVRLTADLEVVLFHDDMILIEGGPKLISEISLNDLSKLVPINSLAEVLSWLSEIKNPQIKLNIELKTSEIFNPILEKKVIELIRQHQVQKQILISSFNPLALARIRYFDPSIYRALLLTLEISPKNKWYLKKMIFNILAKPHALHLFYRDWFKSQRLWSKLKVPVVLWTYNGNLEDLNFEKIHGIISDQIMPENLKV